MFVFVFVFVVFVFVFVFVFVVFVVVCVLVFLCVSNVSVYLHIAYMLCECVLLHINNVLFLNIFIRLRKTFLFSSSHWAC